LSRRSADKAYKELGVIQIHRNLLIVCTVFVFVLFVALAIILQNNQEPNYSEDWRLSRHLKKLHYLKKFRSIVVKILTDSKDL